MNKVTYIVKLVRILNDPMSVVYFLVCITVVYNCQYDTSYSVQHAVVCDAGGSVVWWPQTSYNSLQSCSRRLRESCNNFIFYQ